MTLRRIDFLLTDSKLRERWEQFETAAVAWEKARDAGEEGSMSGALSSMSSALRDMRRALPVLLTTQSAKTIKSLKVKALTGILYMSPADESGINVCPFASPGCKDACLGHSSGRMGMTVNGGLGDHKRARILRTWAMIHYRQAFLAILRHEIRLLEARAEREGFRPFVRLNGTSDVGVETWGIMEQFPGVQFYDYTKSPYRALAWANQEPDLGGRRFPGNYHLTFSRSERNDAACEAVLNAGGNVAVVFAGSLPETWRGRPVVNGDETDARPDDSRGVWIGLTTKGSKAARDDSGFVIRSEQ